MNTELNLAVIDDDLIYHRVVKRLLQTCNYNGRLFTYKNGREAYEALSQNSDNSEELPHIILLDINMPVWDGWDFLNEFKKLSLSINPVIYVVSSTTNPEEINRATTYSCVRDFVEKPLSTGKIMNIMTLEKRR